MPITVVVPIRKMRGRSEAHLARGDDGELYVIKLQNNPEGTRSLVNEVIASEMLASLGICCPQYKFVYLSDEFLNDRPRGPLPATRFNIRPMIHFGSRYPVKSEVTPLYDFLPDSLLERVINLQDFRATLAFDRWVGASQPRQAVFWPVHLRTESSPDPGAGRNIAYQAAMIDHGSAFRGIHWNFKAGPLAPVYFRPQVYGDFSMLDFQPWISKIQDFAADCLDRVQEKIPSDWIDDSTAFRKLLDTLMSRRKYLPASVERSLRALREHRFVLSGRGVNGYAPAINPKKSMMMMTGSKGSLFRPLNGTPAGDTRTHSRRDSQLCLVNWKTGNRKIEIHPRDRSLERQGSSMMNRNPGATTVTRIVEEAK